MTNGVKEEPKLLKPGKPENNKKKLCSCIYGIDYGQNDYIVWPIITWLFIAKIPGFKYTGPSILFGKCVNNVSVGTMGNLKTLTCQYRSTAITIQNCTTIKLMLLLATQSEYL